MIDAFIESIPWLFSGLGVAVCAAVFGFIIKYYFYDRGKLLHHVEVFVGPIEGKSYNEDFYKYFREVIQGARQHIYITGDGFECADRTGKFLAQEFNSTIRNSLENGVHVIRVQTRGNTSLMWANMLSDLLREFPKNFHLYALREGKVSQMSSACVIDPEASKNVVEVMLSTVRMLGRRATDLAGTAVFVHDKQILAQDLKTRIMSLTSEEVAIHIRDPQQVVPILTAEKEFYFAYGSNMSQRQIENRIGEIEYVGVGYLENHKIIFNREGSYRPGGVASVVTECGERVYGTISKVPVAKFVEMDEAEDPSAYERIMEMVVGPDGHKHSCYLYKAIPQGIFKPDPQYLELIIESAEEAGLPRDYIDALKHLRHQD